MPIESPEHKLRLIYRELDGFNQFESQRFHSAEGPKHYLIKHYTAYLINQAGRDVAIECETPGGVVDVLDMGESGTGCVAIELETSCSPQKKRDKLEQYSTDLITEVITVDISDAPTELDALEGFLRAEIPGV